MSSELKLYNVSMSSDLDKMACDDGTLTVFIKTPKDFKCKRKGCTVAVKHKHSTYSCLRLSPKQK